MGIEAIDRLLRKLSQGSRFAATRRRVSANFAAQVCLFASHFGLHRLRKQYSIVFSALTQQREPEKSTCFGKCFFHPIRRIGMESPRGVRCMESVAMRRHGITRQRVFLLRIDYIQHFVLMIYKARALISYTPRRDLVSCHFRWLPC